MLDEHKTEETPMKAVTFGELNIEIINSYLYPRQLITLSKDSQDLELERCIRLSWAAYEKLSGFMIMNIPTKLKSKICKIAFELQHLHTKPGFQTLSCKFINDTWKEGF